MAVPTKALKLSLLSLVTCMAAIATPQCYADDALTRIDGIPIPQSQLAINQGAKPVEHHYFGYHFPPRTRAPSPYIVLLPGCGGLRPLGRKTLFGYAEEFVRRGYGAFVVDIFHGTGIDNTCIDQPGPSFILAALSAARFAKGTPFSNGRFGVVGQSKGGIAALRMSSAELRSTFIYGNVDAWFGAAVAFYPGCSDTKLAIPLLVLIGGKDEWTPSSLCRWWIEKGSTKNLEVVFYPDAHHAFDITGLEVRRPFGFTVGYNRQAAADARRRMYAFFERHLK